MDLFFFLFMNWTRVVGVWVYPRKRRATCHRQHVPCIASCVSFSIAPLTYGYAWHIWQ